MNHLTYSFSIAFFISGHRHKRGKNYGRVLSSTFTSWEQTNKVLPGRSHHHSYQESWMFCKAYDGSSQFWWTKPQKDEGIQGVQRQWKSRDVRNSLQSGTRQPFLKTPCNFPNSFHSIQTCNRSTAHFVNIERDHKVFLI